MNRIFDLDQVTLIALATRKDTPKSILLALTRSEDDDVRKAVAGNINAGQEILSLLAFDSNPFIRCQVASNPSTPESILRVLAEGDAAWCCAGHMDEWIRKAVAGNPNTPPDILDAFVRFEFRDEPSFLNGDGIATTAAKNPRMPVEGLLKDMADGATWVYEYIACNQNAPEGVLRAILSLTEIDLEQSNVGNSFLSLDLRRIMDNLASNPSAPIDLLESRRLDPSIVAANPSSPVSLLQSIHSYAVSSSDVKMALASNPNTPPTILHRISSYIFSDVTNSVAANPSTAKEDLIRLSQKHDLSPSKDFSRTEMRQYSENRRNVASNPNTPIEILSRLYSEGFKASIAVNPSATAEMLSELAADKDEKIRLAVFTNESFDLLDGLGINSDNISIFLEGVFHVNDFQGEEACFFDFLQFIELMSALARREDIPDCCIDFIIERCDPLMRALISENRALTPCRINRLSKDVSKTVREAIACRPDLRFDVLVALAGDRNVGVSKAAKENPIWDSVAEYVVYSDDLESSRRMAADVSADPIKLKALARSSKDNLVLSRIAKNPNTPIDVLMQFAIEGKFAESLAANPSLTEGLADLIVQKMSGDVKFNLLNNPATPSRIFEACSNPKSADRWQKSIASNPSAPFELLDEFASGGAAVLRALVAANPSTSQKTLGDLAKDVDPMVRLRVARNPNSSLEILSSLLADEEMRVRAEVAKNPKSSRLKSEPLVDCETLSKKLRDALSLQTETKRIVRLVNDENPIVRVAAMSNLRYPLSAVLERLSPDVQCGSEGRSVLDKREKLILDLNDIESRLALAGRGDIPKWLQDKLSNDSEPCVRQALASNRYVGTSILEAMFGANSETDVLVALASNPSMPDSIMKKMAAIEDEKVLLALSRNPNVTPEALFLLLQNKSRPTFIGLKLARDPNTRAELLDAMAKSDRLDSFSLEALAANPTTPVDTLIMLAEEKYKNIRASVAENPSTPIDLLSEMADDESCEVRCGVAKNPKLSKSLCIKLFTESMKQFRVPEEVFRWTIENGTPYARYRVASGYDVPEECLIQLANDADPEIRKAVLKNRKTPAGVKERLIEEGAMDFDKDEFCLRAEREWKENQYQRAEKEPYFYLASNPSTPVEILTFLSNESVWKASWRVLSNPSTPRSVLLKHLEEHGGSSFIASRLDASEEMLFRLSKDEHEEVRAAVAQNANTSETILKALVMDSERDVAVKAAKNGSISAEFLSGLAQNADYWIREAIIDNPNITIDILEVLANDSDESVRIKVADCDKATSEILTRLSKDQSDRVRLSVARNRKSLSATLALLSRDRIAEVRINALRNPSLCLSDHFELSMHE